MASAQGSVGILARENLKCKFWRYRKQNAREHMRVKWPSGSTTSSRRHRAPGSARLVGRVGRAHVLVSQNTDPWQGDGLGVTSFSFWRTVRDRSLGLGECSVSASGSIRWEALKTNVNIYIYTVHRHHHQQLSAHKHRVVTKSNPLSRPEA